MHNIATGELHPIQCTKKTGQNQTSASQTIKAYHNRKIERTEQFLRAALYKYINQLFNFEHISDTQRQRQIPHSNTDTNAHRLIHITNYQNLESFMGSQHAYTTPNFIILSVLWSLLEMGGQKGLPGTSASLDPWWPRYGGDDIYTEIWGRSYDACNCW